MKRSFQLILVFSFVFLLCLAVGCKKAEKEGAAEAAVAVDLESANVAANSVLNQMIAAYETEDIALFSKIIAHDPDIVMLGTDAAERFVGYEPVEASMKKQFESYEETKLTSRERVVKVHRSGEVVWWSELWDVQGKAQGQAYTVEGMRVTGVLEKRDGNWVVVQWHASVPVSGQAVKY